MAHISSKEAGEWEFTKDGKPLEHVWEADLDAGWADIVSVDRDGAFVPHPDPTPDRPYDLIRVKGAIRAQSLRTPQQEDPFSRFPGYTPVPPEEQQVISDGDRIMYPPCGDPNCPYCVGVEPLRPADPLPPPAAGSALQIQSTAGPDWPLAWNYDIAIVGMKQTPDGRIYAEYQIVGPLWMVPLQCRDKIWHGRVQ